MLKDTATKLSITIELSTKDGRVAKIEKVADLTGLQPYKQVVAQALKDLVEGIQRMGVLATELDKDKIVN